MVTGPKGTDLPGRVEKYCLECSADVAAVILLTAEIDTATLSGANANDLISEFTVISNRMLGRAQSAELGNL